MSICTECQRDKELRPYGKNGALICFDCMMATPESKAEGEKQFASQLNACGRVAIIGEETGPRPIEKGIN